MDIDMDIDETLSAASLRRTASAKASAAAVANHFLIRGRENSKVPAVDQLKLQGLVFYAQCWHLANYDAMPLFAEDIEAWPWGPVVRSVYNQTRRYGDGPIGGLLMAVSLAAEEPFSAELRTAHVSAEPVRAYLDFIWESYKDYTGIEICNSTHAEGEPWTVVKNLYGKLDQTPVIPRDLIAEVCRRRLRANEAA